jgi:citrate lyase beta subunit
MRSLLFVPADSERKLARAPQSGADALILDLEDSVVPANRPRARVQARDFLDSTGAAGFRRYIRINPMSSGMVLEDLVAVVPGRPEGILLPKCVPEDLRTVDHYLSALETVSGLSPGVIRVIAIATETPAAMFALGGYRGASSRLEAITWGAEDLAAGVGGNNRRHIRRRLPAGAVAVPAGSGGRRRPPDRHDLYRFQGRSRACRRVRCRATVRFRQQNGDPSGTDPDHQPSIRDRRGTTRLGSQSGSGVRGKSRRRNHRP